MSTPPSPRVGGDARATARGPTERAARRCTALTGHGSLLERCHAGSEGRIVAVDSGLESYCTVRASLPPGLCGMDGMVCGEVCGLKSAPLRACAAVRLCTPAGAGARTDGCTASSASTQRHPRARIDAAHRRTAAQRRRGAGFRCVVCVLAYRPYGTRLLGAGGALVSAARHAAYYLGGRVGAFRARADFTHLAAWKVEGEGDCTIPRLRTAHLSDGLRDDHGQQWQRCIGRSLHHGGRGANVLRDRAISGPAALEPALTSAERRAFLELIEWMRATRDRIQLVHAECPLPRTSWANSLDGSPRPHLLAPAHPAPCNGDQSARRCSSPWGRGRGWDSIRRCLRAGRPAGG